MDQYAKVASWDLSTRKANEFCIRRVIKPALGHLQVRKIRGPLLDLLYAQLKRCETPGLPRSGQGAPLDAGRYAGAMTGDLDDGNRVHDEGATMPESAEGRVVDIKKDGDIKISCPEGRDWPTRTKLSILDADGDVVVEVRVVDGDASVVTARYFVPWDAASSAASLIAAAIIPGVGGAIGGALGRVIGAAGKRRGTGSRIHEGMKVVEAPERTANPPPRPAPSGDEGAGGPTADCCVADPGCDC
jgi:hypothetical protein